MSFNYVEKHLNKLGTGRDLPTLVVILRGITTFILISHTNLFSEQSAYVSYIYKYILHTTLSYPLNKQM